MKRIRMRVGRNSEFMWGIISGVFVLLLFFYFISLIIGGYRTDMKQVGTGLLLLLLFLGMIIILIMELRNDENFLMNLHIKGEKIVFRKKRRILKEYDKTELCFRYCILLFPGIIKNIKVAPCLLIGKEKSLPKDLCVNYHSYQENADCFLIVLTKRRWQILSMWYNEKISLPYAKEIFSLDYYANIKNAEVFYREIEQHNRMMEQK